MTLTPLWFGKLTSWKAESFVVAGGSISALPALVPMHEEFAVCFIFNSIWDATEFSHFSKMLLQRGARIFGFFGFMSEEAEHIVDHIRIPTEEQNGDISIPTIAFFKEPIKESLEMLLNVYISNCEGSPVSPALILFYVGEQNGFSELLECLQ